MQEGQEVPIPGPEYFTKEELDRAKAGVQKLKGTLKRCDSSSKKLILNSDAGEQLQCMFLGIKPISALMPGIVERVKAIPLPERFKFVDKHLYDSETTSRTLKENPDVFPDFDGNTDKYMQEFLSKAPAAARDPERIAQVGVLYGFPKMAAKEYANYFPDYYRELISFSIALAPEAIRYPERWGEIAREAVLHYGGYDKTGKVVNDPKYLADFLDQREAEVKEYLTDVNPNWPEDAIDYCVKVRSQHIRAFHFGVRRDLPESITFRERIEGLYEASGMNRVLATSQRFSILRRLFHRS